MIDEPPRCWCGSAELTTFSPDYLACGECGTLVAESRPEPELTRVDDDERGFYGRRYWFEYQELELGNPDITIRARTDLPERCVYWLRAVLRHQLPPARALDVGCGHGAFVMLLGRAGYEAAGLELSPWVVQFARANFGIPVLQGTLEGQRLEPGTLDVITMMDVVEHLPDPAATLAAALAALAERGILVIQTPARPPDLSWGDMVATNHPFLRLMRERGHLYLFSRESLHRLLDRVALRHVAFEPAHFPEYDMFVVASRRPLTTQSSDVVAKMLSGTPDGRLVQALLDLDDSARDLQARYADAECDRVARLAALHEHGARLMGAEAERNALHAELEDFRRYLAAAEADRVARLAVIQDLGERLTASEQDRANRLTLIQELSERLTASERDRADRLVVIHELSEHLAASEKDRADRLAVIQDVEARLAVSEQDRVDRLTQFESLTAQLAASETDRAAHFSVIQEQAQTVSDLRGRVAELEQQTGRLAVERDVLRAELASLRFRRARILVRSLFRRLRALFHA